MPFTKIPSKDIGLICHELLVALYTMQPAFEEFQQIHGAEKKNAKFLSVIPTRGQFALIRELIAPMMMLSMFLKKFQTPGPEIHCGAVDIQNLRGIISTYYGDARKKYEEGNLEQDEMAAVKTCQVAINNMLTNFDEVFQRKDEPLNEATILASLLHPIYRARTILEPAEHDAFLKKLVRKHPSTHNIPPSMKTGNMVSPMLGFTQEQLDAMERGKRKLLDFKHKMFLYRQEEFAQQKEKISPLKCELETYMEKPEPNDGQSTIDWWKEHKDEFPLLAAMARDVFAIQFGVPDDKVSAKKGAISWTEVNPDVNRAGASIADLLFVQNATIPLLKEADKWNCKPLMKVNSKILHMLGKFLKQ